MRANKGNKHITSELFLLKVKQQENIRLHLTRYVDDDFRSYEWSQMWYDQP